MSIDIRIADTAELRADLFPFRHRIWAEELNARFAECDTGLMSDALDAVAINYIACDETGIVGALRVTALARFADVAATMRRYGVVGLAEELTPVALAHAGRFAIERSRRGGDILQKLLVHATHDLVEGGVRAVIFDCSPYLLRSYEALGGVRSGEPFNDPVMGFKLPMVMPLADPAFLASIGSPLATPCALGVADERVIAWRRDMQTADADAAVQDPRAEERDRIARLALQVSRHALFAGLSPQDIQRVLARAALFEAAPGDQVIRPGLREDSLFLVLSGAMDVVSADEPDFTLTSIDEGEFFGEMAYLTDAPRRNCVVARERCEILLLSSDVLRKLRVSEPGIHGALMQNVARTLVERLGAMSQAWRQTRSSYVAA